jgi:hypothetical protein
MVWVKDDSRYKETTCHIYKNNSAVKKENDPYYIFDLTEDTYITFEWVMSGAPVWRLGTSNWNCHIDKRAKRIAAGVII